MKESFLHIPIRPVAASFAAGALAVSPYLLAPNTTESKPILPPVIVYDPAGLAIDESLINSSTGAAAHLLKTVSTELDPAKMATPSKFQKPDEIARELSITMHDFEPPALYDDEYDWYDQTDENVSKAPFEAIYKETRLFAKKYGVNVFVASCDKNPIVGFSGDCLSNSDKNDTAVKQSVLSIGNVLESLPNSFPNDIGLYNVIVQGHLNSHINKKINIGGYAVSQAGLVVLNAYAGTRSLTIFRHELSHILGYKSADEAVNINLPEFEDVNNLGRYCYCLPVPKEFTNSQPLTRDKLVRSEKYHALNLEINNAYIERDLSAMTQAEQEQRDLKQPTEMVSIYSQTQPGEDFAEIGSIMLNSNSTIDILDSSSPVLRSKALIFLARLRITSADAYKYLTGRVRGFAVQNHSLAQNPFPKEESIGKNNIKIGPLPLGPS